jgi:hypothetical protein
MVAFGDETYRIEVRRRDSGGQIIWQVSPHRPLIFGSCCSRTVSVMSWDEFEGGVDTGLPETGKEWEAVLSLAAELSKPEHARFPSSIRRNKSSMRASGPVLRTGHSLIGQVSAAVTAPTWSSQSLRLSAVRDTGCPDWKLVCVP